jgi:hypothetical protein
MALDGILIKIRTTFEGKGAQEASKSLDALDQSSRRAAPALEKTGEAAGKAGKATRVSTEEFARAAKMASAAGGSLEGVGAVVSQLGTRIAGFAAALPVLGLVWAAFVSWKTVIDTLIERHREQLRLLREIKDTNIAASLDAITKAYARMNAELDRTADKQQIMLDGQIEMLKVEQDLSEAKLKMAETAELAAEKDPIKQEAIRARYEAMQQTGRASSGIALQQMKIGGMNQELSTNDERLFNKRTREQDLLGIMEAVSASATDSNLSQEERKTALAAQQEAANEIATNRKEQQQLELRNEKLADQIAVETKRVEVMRLTASDAQTRQGWEVQKQDARVRVADLAAQKSAAEAQLTQATDSATTAKEYLTTVPERIASGTYSQADQSAMLQALASAQEQTALLQSFISRIGQELSKQNEILRTIHTGN